jgi:hypothetical protein
MAFPTLPGRLEAIRLLLLPMMMWGSGCDAEAFEDPQRAPPASSAAGAPRSPTDPDADTHDPHTPAGHVGHAGHVDHAGQGGYGPGDAHGGHGAAEVDRGARMRVSQESSRQVRMTLGPVALPSAEHGMVMRVTPALEAPIGFDGWIVGLDVSLQDADGNVLPRDLLHHVNVILPGRRDLFQPMMQRLAAAGQETAPMKLPWPLGLRVAGDEEVLLVAMLHNESGASYDAVYVVLDFQARRRGRIAVHPWMMDVSPPPAPASWDLPPGRSQRSWEASPAVDGRIFGIGAHMHRYGQELILEDVTEGRVLYRSRPELDANGQVVAIPHKVFPTGLRIRAAHRYRITAVYDNPTGQTIVDGAMGVFGGIIRTSAAWPAADRNAPLYLEDRAGTFR